MWEQLEGFVCGLLTQEELHSTLLSLFSTALGPYVCSLSVQTEAIPPAMRFSFYFEIYFTLIKLSKQALSSHFSCFNLSGSWKCRAMLPAQLTSFPPSSLRFPSSLSYCGCLASVLKWLCRIHTSLSSHTPLRENSFN